MMHDEQENSAQVLPGGDELEKVASQTVDSVIMCSTRKIMNGQVAADDHDSGRRKVNFCEDARVLVSPLNGTDTADIHQESLAENGNSDHAQVLQVKIASDNDDRELLKKEDTMEDPNTIKEALHRSLDNSDNDLDDETIQNTRRNSVITPSGLQLEVEEDPDPVEVNVNVKKRSTLPINFKKALKGAKIGQKKEALVNNFKKFRESTSKLTKKPENAEKQTVVASNSVKLPTKDDLSQGFKNVRRRISKSLSVRGVREDQVTAVKVNRHPTGSEEAISLHSSSAELDYSTLVSCHPPTNINNMATNRL
ncbi:hypothetical protein Ciccas_011234 [Cichlidogyrus casuarinus]|uniref:Uncharacterized protein n=1 Tax=Cichlidogyrus casuarinus TaxID=1844966 RepID=A0ABD2PRW1_9PLAT